MKVNSFNMRRPDDFHVHLRDVDLLPFTVQHTARFGRALVMPNTVPPILTGIEAHRYRSQIVAIANAKGYAHFWPLTTIKLTQRTEVNTIPEAHDFGVVAAKLYPEGVTTNSSDGVSDPDALDLVFEAMARVEMVLCIHAEEPGAPSLLRETGYLQTVDRIAKKHPSLKIVIEHVTTHEAVQFVLYRENVAATITVHHLLLTLDDVIGDKLQPHNFCKPIAKDVNALNALRDAAFGGNPRFFLGTDSAPHVKERKESAAAPAGCFTAPFAMEMLAGIFEEAGQLGKLENFASKYGAEFYGLPLNHDRIVLEREEWTIPAQYGPVVPFRAGTKLQWRIR